MQKGPVHRVDSLRPSDSLRPCPACGQNQWLVGRVTAECAACSTALSLDPADPWTARACTMAGSARNGGRCFRG